MAKKHIHKYKFAIVGKDYRVYACALSDCYHYIQEDLVVGKQSICWRCGLPCEVRREKDGTIRRKPHHATCNAGRQKGKIAIKSELKPRTTLDDVQQMLDKLLEDSKTGT